MKLIILIISLTETYSKIISGNHEQDFTGKCIADIVKKLNDIFTVIIYENNLNNETDDLRDNFSELIVKELINSKVPYSVVNENTNIKVLINEIKGNVIVVIRIIFCEDLRTIHKQITNWHWKLIIVVDTETIKCKEIISDIATHRIAAIQKEDMNTHKILAVKRVIDGNTCHVNSAVETTNLCIEGKLINDKVFHSKERYDYQKCPFRVGMAKMYPFTNLKTNDLKTFTSIPSVKGSDVEIAKIIAKYLNSDLQLYFASRDEINPYIITDFIDFMKNGSLEMSAGGLYNVYGDLVDYSGIYNRQAVIWVYTVNREERHWKNMVTKIYGMYIFFIFQIVYSVVWKFVSRFDNHEHRLLDTLLHSWGALFSTSNLQTTVTFKQKLLNIVFYYMCLHVSAYVSIQFYSFLTIQSPPETFKTNEDIVTSGKTPFLSPRTKMFIVRNYPDYVTKSVECNDFKVCEEMVLKYDGVTAILDGFLIPFLTSTIVGDEAKVLMSRDNIVTVYHEIVIRKGSPIVEDVQEVTRRLFEAGICDKLYKEAMDILTVDKAEIAMKNILGNSYKCQEGCSITWTQIAGVFYVWCFGCVVSIVIFLFECYSAKIVQ